MARTIAENGPLATRGTKRIARMRETSGFAAARKLSDELRTALEWTNDVDEGIAAVRESRKPQFTGTIECGRSEHAVCKCKFGAPEL